jgi:hypothetical protein
VIKLMPGYEDAIKAMTKQMEKEEAQIPEP